MPLKPLHVVVPVRSLSDGKRRLGLAVDAEERAALVVGLLRGTIEATRAVVPPAGVTVVSADATVLQIARRLGAAIVAEAAHDDLNGALRQARDSVVDEGAAALLYLPADLPLLSDAALARLIDAADAAQAAGGDRPIVVIAPADARAGTNALLLAPPAIIEPSFGAASLGAHLQLAARAGATVQIVADLELGFDLDTPDDLERLEPTRLVELLELGARTLDELAPTPATPAA